MDYYCDPTEAFPSTKPRAVLSSSATLRILEKVLDPTTSSSECLRDCILVSIDIGFEHPTDGPGSISSIGISALDTRILSTFEVSDENKLESAVSSGLYLLTGMPIPLKSGVPQYLFGTAQQLRRKDVYEKVRSILSPLDEDGNYRNVILVGHNIMSDLTMLSTNMDINLKDIPTISAIVDSERLVCDLHNFYRTKLRVSLQHTLICLGIRYMYLHNSGNDAHFTLRALLLLFCKWKSEKEFFNFNQPQEEKLLWEERLRTLSSIGRFWGGVIPVVRSTRKRTIKIRPRTMVYDGDVWDSEQSCMGDLLTIFEDEC